MKTDYDPNAAFEVQIFEESFRPIDSRTLMARVYQPQGSGPFPTVLDLHGGAWNGKDRTANATMDEAIAASGLLVVAIDLRLAPEAPYPASVEDANYGIRWLKSKAAGWNGDPATLGLLGSSSGGHVAQLLGMRQQSSRYASIELEGHPEIDARVCYVATRSPISDPVARYQNAVNRGREEMVQRHHVYFNPWDDIHEASPQGILDRAEQVDLPPMLIMQGELDDNVLPSLQEKFAASYRAAGGECQLEIFQDGGHIWVEEPGPQTDRAHEILKAFIAGQLRAQ